MRSSHSDHDLRLWGALLGTNPDRRSEAARTVRALEQELGYTHQILAALPDLQTWQRANAGHALALLGDPRFSPPHFLSEMIAVPSGEVILGSGDYREERPRHTAWVGAFSLSQFQVTQVAYAVFVGGTGHRNPRGWDHRGPHPEQMNAPVVCVSARDAEAYCAWLSSETGDHYRLPTEAEWVMAARGPADKRIYPWGDVFDDLRANAWSQRSIGRLCAVGLFPNGRGPLGHEDLAGNVWEWCSSLYWPYPYRVDDGREDSTSDDPRAMHGGSWRNKPVSIRCSARQGEPPADSFEVVGFRIARSD